MGGDIRVNLTNFVTVGLMAFAGLYAINRLATYAGKPQWRVGA